MIRPTGTYIDIEPQSGNVKFEEPYIALRRKEQRLYSDEEVKQLPLINPNHPHYAEWLVRKHSSEKLIKHIRKMKRPLRILEAGCGNGWLSNKLAGIPDTHVTGFDINSVELQQAKRVFHHQHNLQFVSNNPLHAKPPENLYDVIIFAASIQYFASLDAVITDALQHLQQDGYVHIIDSHFYKPRQIPAAKQRTAAHYSALGFPEMSAHYFHHTLSGLNPFHVRILYNPNTLWNKLKRKKAPFPWISIKKP